MILGRSLSPCGYPKVPSVLLLKKENCCLGIKLPRGAGVFDTSDLNFTAVSDFEDLLIK